jgi:bifunctional UDP-N-acetylglucosamine pyrophosphorylase/glucosamine-1-phosphate N-acetyltransferase
MANRMSAKTKPRSLAAVILAAGKGKRMRSASPKVLVDLCGRPLLWHAIQAARAARPIRIVIVISDRSHGADAVREAVGSWRIRPEPVFVEQGEPLGTGHAVLVAERAVGSVDEVLVIGGDYDPVTGDDLRALVRLHRRTGSAASILSADADRPGKLARVVRDPDDPTRLLEIVEGSDATPTMLRRREVSTLDFVFRRKDLFAVLPMVGRQNRQREYYLNDVLPILMGKGERVSALKVDIGGVLGANSRAGSAALRRLVQGRILERHMANGVSFVDPDTSYVDVDVRIGPDTLIQPMTFLQGSTRIGAGASIGPATRIVDSTVGDGADVTFSVVRSSRIGPRANVGPYASLRPGTVLDEAAKAGTFVEVKASRIGPGSKVPHLSYVGDTRIGRRVNVGAATVTVNYDGFEKHPTVIGDEAHIGSDTMLVAPVRVGKRAWTGAGSVITKDVPDGALAVERTEQRIVAGYDGRARQKKERRKGRG